MAAITKKEKLSYFREVQNELRKVTWTSREELIFCTKVVILGTFFFGLSIYVVDLGIRGSFELAGTLVRMIFG